VTEATDNEDTYGVILPVSAVMERRFTKEELELGARVSFFAHLSSDPESWDLADGATLKLKWNTDIIRNNKMILASARVKTITQEGRSAKTEG
jgi:hypothetical protein